MHRAATLDAATEKVQPAYLDLYKNPSKLRSLKLELPIYDPINSTYILKNLLDLVLSQ